LTDDGTVFTWGVGADGQLGLGNFEDSLLPQKVPPILGIPIFDSPLIIKMRKWHELLQDMILQLFLQVFMT
jgi:hypothetical protein